MSHLILNMSQCLIHASKSDVIIKSNSTRYTFYFSILYIKKSALIENGCHMCKPRAH